MGSRNGKKVKRGKPQPGKGVALCPNCQRPGYVVGQPCPGCGRLDAVISPPAMAAVARVNKAGG